MFLTSLWPRNFQKKIFLAHLNNYGYYVFNGNFTYVLAGCQKTILLIGRPLTT